MQELVLDRGEQSRSRWIASSNVVPHGRSESVAAAGRRWLDRWRPVDAAGNGPLMARCRSLGKGAAHGVSAVMVGVSPGCVSSTGLIHGCDSIRPSRRRRPYARRCRSLTREPVIAWSGSGQARVLRCGRGRVPWDLRDFAQIRVGAGRN